MAARGQSLAERLSRWQVLVSNLRETEGFTHVTEELSTLERLLGEARTLENQKDGLRSQVRAINAQLRVLSKDGDGLRTRLGANLQGEVRLHQRDADPLRLRAAALHAPSHEARDRARRGRAGGGPEPGDASARRGGNPDGHRGLRQHRRPFP